MVVNTGVRLKIIAEPHGIRLDKSMPKPLMPSYQNLCGLRQWELQFTWSTFLSPSVPLNGDIPERVWTRKDVSYSHADVFGCRAFVHIPKDEKSKLDDKAKQCIFLGYGHEKFSYRLLDPVPPPWAEAQDDEAPVNENQRYPQQFASYLFIFAFTYDNLLLPYFWLDTIIYNICYSLLTWLYCMSL